MTIPKDLKKFIAIIKTELPKVLGDVLFGIYIYGSLSYGDFEEHRSDIDVIVVLKRNLNNREFKQLKKFYNSRPIRQSRWFGRLEMDYALKNKLIAKGAQEIKTTHFAGGKLYRRAHSAAANPLIWINIHENGIVLFGPKPKTFVPKISFAMIRDGLASDFKQLQKKAPIWVKIDLWNQVYIVTTLCRIVYTLQKKVLVSKKAADQWGQENLPKKFRPLVGIALARIDNFMGPLEKTISDGLPGFMNYVDKLFSKK